MYGYCKLLFLGILFLTLCNAYQFGEEGVSSRKCRPVSLVNEAQRMKVVKDYQQDVVNVINVAKTPEEKERFADKSAPYMTSARLSLHTFTLEGKKFAQAKYRSPNWVWSSKQWISEKLFCTDERCLQWRDGRRQVDVDTKAFRRSAARLLVSEQLCGAWKFFGAAHMSRTTKKKWLRYRKSGDMGLESDYTLHQLIEVSCSSKLPTLCDEKL